MVDSALYSSDKVEYGTPDWVKDPIIAALGLNFDAAASHENHVLPRYATKDGVFVKNFSSPSTPSGWRQYKNGLDFPWYGARVWCNPPYGSGRMGHYLGQVESSIETWVRKAALSTQVHRDFETGQQEVCEVAALLLPARTETEWFQRWVFPYAEVHFLMSRIKFIGGATSAPFPSVIAVYSPDIVVPPGRALARTLDLKSSGEFTSSILESKSRENRVTVHHRSRGTTTRESFR